MGAITIHINYSGCTNKTIQWLLYLFSKYSKMRGAAIFAHLYDSIAKLHSMIDVSS